MMSKSNKTPCEMNGRYKYFSQEYYTAGDEEQFMVKSKLDENASLKNPYIYRNPTCDEDIHMNILPLQWEKYKDIDRYAVKNTFRYMFNKFKKGVYVSIRDNKVETFLPFDNANYRNEWYHLIDVNSIKRSHKINRYVNKWYANDYLVRNEFPPSFNDTNISEIKDLFEEVCKHHQVPNLDFFVNKRDFPVMTKDSTEPYTSIFGEKYPLVSHRYAKHAPVLGFSWTTKHAEIPIPTPDEWGAIRNEEGVFFNTQRNSEKLSTTLKTCSWSDKKNMCLWRGSSTGYGFDRHTNIRMKACDLSLKHPEILDAGITKWTIRPRKVKGSQEYRYNKVDKELEKPFVSMGEQYKYKFILVLDGHARPYRMSQQMRTGSCLLLQDSPYSLWFESFLKPYVHYVPVSHDLGNLMDQIQWCLGHDELCEKIADNARKFFSKTLQKSGVLHYTATLLLNIKKTTGYYIDTPDILYKEDMRRIKELVSPTSYSYIPKTQIFKNNKGTSVFIPS